VYESSARRESNNRNNGPAVGYPFGPGSIVNQLYQCCLELRRAIRRKNSDEKWKLWRAFQRYYVRALLNAKNINEELPLPGQEWFPDAYLMDPIQDDISDDAMDEVAQIVIDWIEKKMRQKGLSMT
jgi:hypothetical protein